MRNAPRKPIATKVIRDGADLVIYAYAGKRKIGHLQVFRVRRPGELDYRCQADLKRIQGTRPGITVYMVWKSHVAPRYRRRGAGAALYEAALAHVRSKHAPAAVALVPMDCQSYGCTSNSAKRVWRSLARRREGTSRAILANPGRAEDLAEIVQSAPRAFAVGGEVPGRLLGCAGNGCVFQAGVGKVIKVSLNDYESRLAMQILGPRQEPFLPEFYAARVVAGETVGLPPVFRLGVLLREDLSDLPMPTRGLYDEAVNEMLDEEIPAQAIVDTYRGHLSSQESQALFAIDALLAWGKRRGFHFDRNEFRWEDPEYEEGYAPILPNAVDNMGVTRGGVVVVRDLGGLEFGLPSRNPPRRRRNAGEGLRRLEREAATGDLQARAALEAARIRAGAPPVPLPQPGTWVQVGGDFNPEDHGGVIAAWIPEGGHVELREIQPVTAYLSLGEVGEVPYPFWSKEASVELAGLSMVSEGVPELLARGERSIPGITAVFAQADLLNRASILYELAKEHGHSGMACPCTGEEGPSGWSPDVLPVSPDLIRWFSGEAQGQWREADEAYARLLVESAQEIPDAFPWNAQAIYEEFEDEDA